MARDAAGLVDLLAGIELQRADRRRTRADLRRRDSRMRDEQKKDEKICASEMPHARKGYHSPAQALKRENETRSQAGSEDRFESEPIVRRYENETAGRPDAEHAS